MCGGRRYQLIAPELQEINATSHGSSTTSDRLRRLHIQIFAVTWLVYFAPYFTRQAFSAAKVGILGDPSHGLDDRTRDGDPRCDVSNRIRRRSVHLGDAGRSVWAAPGAAGWPGGIGGLGGLNGRDDGHRRVCVPHGGQRPSAVIGLGSPVQDHVRVLRGPFSGA